MNNWIGLGIIAFLILCGLFGLWHLSKPYDVSAEEFEKRAKEGPGLLNAGVVGLQKVLDPAMRRSVEVQEDLKQGRYNKKDNSGDPPEGGDRDGDRETGRRGDGETG